ncbi:MAG: phosphoadenylyl-sulfate reductase [Proteobacteria bacterium]|nr:phosphoadenylyl-sulfate reductase [Pseudomonadota bacterium]
MPTLDLTRARPAPLAALSAEAAELERLHGSREAAALVELALGSLFAGRIALVSSFGAESAVLLHMAAEADRHVPVIFVDTGRHFRETLGYRDALVTRLGLTDVRAGGPSADEARARDPWLALAEQDPDACCGFRKVAPLARALEPFAAWMSGRKRFQAETRSGLKVFEAEGTQIKVNPLAGWGAAEIAAYAEAHDLPPHPLVAEGYPSIGCAPCTSRVAAGEDARAGRWRGTSKTECGIHRPVAATAGL